MSHIHDLIGVVRGLRLVIEAGVKVRQESLKLKWVNSSFKTIIQTCPTNPLTASKLTPDNTKDILERAYVVAHGFRQYAAMYIPNLSNDLAKRGDMDSHVQDEIEELNKEFNKTFEILEKEKARKAAENKQFEAPLENLREDQETLRPSTSQYVSNVPVDKEPKTDKPKVFAKKKIRVSVSIKHGFLLLNILLFSKTQQLTELLLCVAQA